VGVSHRRSRAMERRLQAPGHGHSHRRTHSQEPHACGTRATEMRGGYRLRLVPPTRSYVEPDMEPDMEPEKGIEPLTYALRVRCSAV
jgi:hypothetical protein